MRLLGLLLPLALLANAVPARSATIDVPGDHTTIAAALLAASAGDTIRVSQGIYPEHNLQMKSHVTIEGATGVATDVTIDAMRLGRVFDCTDVFGAYFTGIRLANGEEHDGGAVLLEGSARLPSGCSATFVNCEFCQNNATYSGGALYCGRGANVYVTECHFQLNIAAEYGGAVHVYDGSSSANCYFGGCTFFQNGSGEQGGAVRTMYGGTLSFTACDFESNTSSRGGAADVRYAGNAIFNGCSFERNEGRSDGGAMFIFGSQCAVAGSVFVANSSAHGGAVCVDETLAANIQRCTFALNESSAGSAVYVWDVDGLEIDRCIMALAPVGVPVYCYESTVTLADCCVYGNADGDWVGAIAGQGSANDNKSDDPLFCDVFGDDCTLCSNSPCLPGNNEGMQIGAFLDGCGNCDAPVEEVSWGAIKALYR